VEFDHRELANQLIARGVQDDCPACGQTNLGHNVSATVLALCGVNADGTLNDQRVNVAALICPGCGYTQLHARHARRARHLAEGESGCSGVRT
jgi:predicted nucleic-acid-binding Zn-ribbon protein